MKTGAGATAAHWQAHSIILLQHGFLIESKLLIFIARLSKCCIALRVLIHRIAELHHEKHVFARSAFTNLEALY